MQLQTMSRDDGEIDLTGQIRDHCGRLWLGRFPFPSHRAYGRSGVDLGAAADCCCARSSGTIPLCVSLTLCPTINRTRTAQCNVVLMVAAQDGRLAL